MMLAILRVVAILVFAYLTWRNLKDNYQEETLVTYSWLALIIFFIVARVGYGLINFGVWNDSWINWFTVWNKPGMDYTSGFLGLMLFSFWFSKLNNLKVWPFAEDVIVNVLIFLSVLMADEVIKSKFNLKVGILLLFLILMAFFAKFIKGKYRSLVWYKSGKKGFGFFTTCALGFLLLSILGILFKFDLWVIIIHAILSLISFFGILILGEIISPLSINKRK